ncbi:MAG: NAD-dependent epimerase/dehydratase family protein [Longimicrobiales bacterium]
MSKNGTSRRDFVKTSAAAGAALALGAGRTHAEERVIEKADAPLKILVLGGTGFTGPHQVNYAVARGHQVTVFNRGRRQADIPKSVDHLQGDRNEPNGVAALKSNRTWDVVIDVPTTNPRWVREAAGALKGRANQYIFVSTISTYDGFPKAWMDETAAVAKYTGEKDPFTLTPQEAAGGNLYGPLKVLSEQEAEKWFPGKTTVVRPGLIVGPGDPSNRFTYWPVRVARGGEVLAPGDGKDPVQIIDARDLAEWIIRLAEQNVTGTYNATGPKSALTMGEMLGGIRAVMPGDLDIRFTWVAADFLAEQQVSGWSHMPVWMTPRPNNQGWSRINVSKAISKGLTYRSLAETTRATLDWHKTRPAADLEIPRPTAQPGAGLAPDKELAVLTAWKAKTATSTPEAQ